MEGDEGMKTINLEEHYFTNFNQGEYLYEKDWVEIVGIRVKGSDKTYKIRIPYEDFCDSIGSIKYQIEKLKKRSDKRFNELMEAIK